MDPLVLATKIASVVEAIVAAQVPVYVNDELPGFSGVPLRCGPRTCHALAIAPSSLQLSLVLF